MESYIYFSLFLLYLPIRLLSIGLNGPPEFIDTCYLFSCEVIPIRGNKTLHP